VREGHAASGRLAILGGSNGGLLVGAALIQRPGLFRAAVQAATSSGPPVLLRVETRAGHGQGKPLAKVIEEWTDVWSFLFTELAMEP